MAKKKKQQQNSKSNKILQDHKPVGKKLVPPFIHKLEKLTFVKWLDNLLPELIWIALLLQKFGLKEGIDYVGRLSEATRSAVKTNKSQAFCFVSEYVLVGKKDIESIRSNFGADISKVLSALAPLLSLYPNCPMAILFYEEKIKIEEDKKAAYIASMKEAVRQSSDRREKFAMYVQTTCYYVLLKSGKVKIASHLESANFDLNDILSYPDTETSRKLAASVRAMLTGFGMSDEPASKEWTSYFWNRGFEISPCESWKRSENGK